MAITPGYDRCSGFTNVPVRDQFVWSCGFFTQS